MKTTIFNKKAPAFLGAAAVLLAAVFTIGCKTDKRSGAPAPETFTVEMTAGEHGTLSASPVIPANGKVAKDTVITFTAAPASGYKVDKWTITGGTFEAGTGTEGSLTAKVKITANTTVKVSFYKEYVKVALADLDNHLKNAAPDTDGIYYIEVTGLTAANLEGRYEYNLYSYKPSALGKILNDNQTKKVALKLSEVSGLTNMRGCFSGCTSLTQAPEIPSGVTDMSWCFYGCTSLTQAPVIPSSVTDMTYCFLACKSLTQAPVIPSGVTNMDSCFYACESLTQAPVIPSNVTDMTYCFYCCTSLTQAPMIPSKVTDMEQCFFGCTSLTQAPVIPSSVTNMEWCFYGCTSLTQAPVIPSNVTDMSWCFYGCTSLTQAPVIPSSVTNMKKCFMGCKNITTVTLKCNYVDGSFTVAFYDCDKLSAGSIKVPSGQLKTYQDNAGIMGAQENWFVAE